MGYEPIVEALEAGADVVLAGRSCDDALMAAYPDHARVHPALALHMGKLLECGAIASEPAGMDVLVGVIGDDYFDLVPGSARRACTPMSVASHSLYERENPLLQQGPGGTLDLSEIEVEPLSDRAVRVRGARYEPASEYRVKLEGVRSVGFRAIAIAGVRCPSLVRQIGPVLRPRQDARGGLFRFAGPARRDRQFNCPRVWPRRGHEVARAGTRDS